MPFKSPSTSAQKGGKELFTNVALRTMIILSPARSYLDTYVQNKEQVNCEERGRQEIQKLNKSVWGQ